MRKPIAALALLLAADTSALAQTTTFPSPNGVQEECRALPHMPGGVYSKGDQKKEAEYCAVDFYAGEKIALCPKTWSTSPGTIVYDITGSGKSQSQFEAQSACGRSKLPNDLVKFKQSMNQTGTSGTFSPSSLLYYHFSRYFDATVDVPVAVYRSMDKDAHRSRVSHKAFSGNLGKSGMNKVGWQWLDRSEQDPAAYKPTDELFTADRKQIYGVLLAGGGERYGPEVNGIRSAWGVPQNNDFQNTPAFLALRSAKPLKEAIQEGLQQGMKNAQVAKAMGGGASDFQMAVWMKELSEIVLLDYIFSQQDRIGNIDYKWFVYSVDQDGNVKSQKVDGKVARPAIKTIVLPPGTTAANLIQKTQMSDNDAGARRSYVNFTKQTKMLEKVRHLNADAYRKLVALHRDLQSEGPLYQYARDNFHLASDQLSQLVSNTAAATAILQATCKSGELRFDLHAPEEAVKGATDEIKLDCDQP